MESTIISKTQIEGKASGVSYIHANVDGIEYKTISPKFILNKDLFGNCPDINHKTKDYITHGINTIDIDWNGAVVGDNTINTTSELLTMIANMYLNQKTTESANYAWEEVIEIEDTYKLYYEDINNNIISEYNEIPIQYMLNGVNVAPLNADHIGVYNSNNERLYRLTLNSKYASIKQLNGFILNYSVGLLSDIHYNDTCALTGQHDAISDDNKWAPYEDLEHILQYMDNEKTDFICCAGDITTDDINHLDSFKTRLDSLYSKDFYSCVGNHDNNVIYNNIDKWLEVAYPNTKVTKFIGDEASFYFTYKNDLYIFLSINYGNTGSSASKILNSMDYNFIDTTDTNYQYYKPNSIRQLQELLDNNRSKRTFVFSHLPLANKAGNANYEYTNIRYQNYVLSGVQFALLNELNNYYKNAIFFTGHTHYQWKWQQISDRANVCNYDVLNDDYNYNDYDDYGKNKNSKYTVNKPEEYVESGYNVHLPSACRPLRLESLYGLNYNEAIADPGAEAAIMDVYDNGVHIKGLVFADENTHYEYKHILDESTYSLITIDDIYVDTDKPGYNNTQMFAEDGDYIYVRFGNGNILDGDLKIEQSFNISTSSEYIHIEDIQIILNNNDITYKFNNLDNPYIGFKTVDGKYSIKDCKCKLTNGEITLSIDNKLLNMQEISLPLAIKFKAYTCDGISHNIIDYEDKKSSIANYFLQIPNSNLTPESTTFEYFLNKVQQYNK